MIGTINDGLLLQTSDATLRVRLSRYGAIVFTTCNQPFTSLFVRTGAPFVK